MTGHNTQIIHYKDLLERGEHPPKDSSCIVFIKANAPLKSKRIPLSQDKVLIGRDPDTDLQVECITVSRRHAILSSTGQGWSITDLDSKNGLFINGEFKTQSQLKDRDVIRMGNTVFKFLSGNTDEALFHDELYQLTTTDPLTNAYNRRYFFESLDREMSVANRHHTSVSVVILDLDHFKQINDTFGHPIGDQVLIHLTNMIKPRLRREDVFARIGGEEFAFLLVHTNNDGAVQFANEIRDLIAATPFAVKNKRINLRASLGVATHEGHRAIKSTTLVRKADENLYRAKAQGRNCVVA